MHTDMTSESDAAEFTEFEDEIHRLGQNIIGMITAYRKQNRHSAKQTVGRGILENLHDHTQALRGMAHATHERLSLQWVDYRMEEKTAAEYGESFDEPVPFPASWYTRLFVKLDTLDRQLRHELSGTPILPLPAVEPLNVSDSRIIVVARVCWLHTRMFDHESTFPDKWMNRFDTGQFTQFTDDDTWAQRSFFFNNLPPASWWMISGHYEVPIDAEWSAIFEVVGAATEFEFTSLAKLRDIYAGEVKEDAMERVAEFTEPAVVNGECPICGDNFGADNVEGNEPAVMTICGHHIGQNCLQSWNNVAQEQNSEVTCPNCRTSLVVGMFPLRAQAKICELLSYLASDRALDMEIDTFLLTTTGKPSENGCYKPEIGVMLAKLMERTEIAKQMFNDCLL